MNTKAKEIYLCKNPSSVTVVYHEATRAALPCPETIYTKEDILANPEAFGEVESVFSTWGMPNFTEEEIRTYLPSLKNVFYAAGSVQGFARPFLQSGVRVFSAWAANGVPVAEYTVAQILLANKGFFSTAPLQSTGDIEGAKRENGRHTGNFDVTVGIIGAGMIGKMVIGLLKNFRMQVLVFDPFLSDAQAVALGCEKVDLPTLFERCEVVSNHLADNRNTRGMLTGDLFRRMKPYATFINTGRGAQVVEAELAAVLAERPDLYAILDVTYPEPPAPGHPFYSLPNCILTPHIAGSQGREVWRMSEYMAKAYRTVTAGEACPHEVTLAMLETMA